MAEVVEILAIHINKLLGPGHQLLPDLKDLVLRHAPAGARHELRFDLRSIDDLVRGRRSAQQLSMRLGARGRIALAVATAVSEIGRIILAHSGSAAFCIDRLTGPRAGVLISATGSAREGGAPPRGQTHLPRDQELAILVARRLMDEFSIETSPDGSVTLTVVKYFDTARRDQR